MAKKVAVASCTMMLQCCGCRTWTHKRPDAAADARAESGNGDAAVDSAAAHDIYRAHGWQYSLGGLSFEVVTEK
ncbi:g5992 [Coccomyxa elongata]